VQLDGNLPVVRRDAVRAAQAHRPRPGPDRPVALRDLRRHRTLRGLRGAPLEPVRDLSTERGPLVEKRPMSLAFLLTTLVIVATPGTGVLYTLAPA